MSKGGQVRKIIVHTTPKKPATLNFEPLKPLKPLKPFKLSTILFTFAALKKIEL